jgi:hypothetical protein
MDSVEMFLSDGTGGGAAGGGGDGFSDGFGGGDGFGNGGGFGYGIGYGDGGGFCLGDGCGSGSGAASGGFRFGNGDGFGNGYGNGNGYGSCNGSGAASGGDGFGNGGDGAGFGNGDGFGSGYGYGSGKDVKSINGEDVHIVDGVQTVIRRVHGNVARGAMLESDLTLRPCYVAKGSGMFAHGRTLGEAMGALGEKLFDGMDEGGRIEAFISAHKDDVPYPNQGLSEWHGKLTGSCLMGREAFAKGHGVDLAGSMTVHEFYGLTKDAYGGDVVGRMYEQWGAL